ncbi:MAG: cytochrome c biogenesis protein CcdA [Thermodesulfobacteriota bacterium]
MQSHLVTVVGDGLLIEGHVPGMLLRALLARNQETPSRKILIYQDDMGKHPKSYRLWTFAGPPQEFPIDTPLNAALAAVSGQTGTPPGLPLQGKLLLPTVVVAGLLDGLSPCAFAVLAFLVAFLFAIRRVRRDVLAMGVLFIASVYVSYFLIGLGLLRAFTLPGPPHLVGHLGAYLLILLGVIGLAKLALPRFPLKLAMPRVAWETIRGIIQKATIPSAVLAGFLVGFCTLPCSGGIYVATLGLLAGATTYLKGLGYLTVYNFANIVPLVAVLALVGNRGMSLKLAQCEHSGARWIKGIFAGLELAMGIAILMWII